MNFRKILLLIPLVTVLGACKMRNNTLNKSFADCNINAPVIGKIENKKGLVIKDSQRGRYVLSVHSAGTIDEVSMYLICNPDTSLLTDGETITVSGNVRSSQEVSGLGGTTYYNLEVTNISK